MEVGSAGWVRVERGVRPSWGEWGIAQNGKWPIMVTTEFPMGLPARPLPPGPILITPDTRRRVTFPALPGIEPNQTLELLPDMDGSYRLVPIVTIPKNQLWAWSPKVMADTASALAEFNEGKTVDLDSEEGKAFLKKLGKS